MRSSNKNERRRGLPPLALAAALAAAIAGSALADGVDDSRSGQAALSEADYDLAIHFLSRAIRSGELSLEVLAHAFYNRGIAYGRDGQVRPGARGLHQGHRAGARFRRRLQQPGRHPRQEGRARERHRRLQRRRPAGARRCYRPRVPGDRLREDGRGHGGRGRVRRQRPGDHCGRGGLVAAASTESFTWVDGKTYRYLGSEFLCAEDGSLRLWQRANAAGKFGPLRATAQNCGLR